MSIASRINEMTEHLRNDWDSINKLGLKAKKLPDEYKQVEYIESSGTQYIDTGVNADSNLRVVLDMQYTSNVETRVGAIKSDSGNYTRYHFDKDTSNHWRCYFVDSSINMGTFDLNRHIVQLDAPNKVFKVDNSSSDAFTYNSFDTGINFWLFGRNGNLSNLKLYNYSKIYNAKMYYDGTLVRDFVPCYRNSDNEVGLYDIINDVFYTNQGTGVFTYGEIQEEIPNKNIKNIAPVLDRFYNQSSDKTDLAKNGVVGKTRQDGDPTPENPVEINNLSGDVEYKVRGKNLLDKYNNLFQGTFLTAEGGNDSIVSSTMFRCCTKKIDISNLSGDIICSGGYFELFAFYDENNNLISYVQNPTTTIPNGTKNVRVRFFSDDTEIPVSALQQLDLMVENNSTATSYEPYISESFPLSLKSKNLFDKDNEKVLSAYISASAKITSERNDRVIYIPCKPNTTYTLQKMVQEPLAKNRFRVGTSENEPTYNTIVNQFYNPGDGKNIGNYTITTNAIANYLIFYCYYALNNTVTFEEILDSIQIEEGSTATTYEPYYDIELCSIDTYEDKIYSSDGRFYLNKNIKKHLFTTSDVIPKGSSSTDGYARCGWGSSSEIATSDFNKILVKCNKFLGMSQNNNTTSLTGEHWYCSLSNSDTFKIMFRCGDTEYTRDTFPEFIKNNEIIVYYPLKEPTITEITQENYPTLYSQLIAIQEFLTKYKINKEFLLDYSSPEIEY